MRSKRRLIGWFWGLPYVGIAAGTAHAAMLSTPPHRRAREILVNIWFLKGLTRFVTRIFKNLVRFRISALVDRICQPKKDVLVNNRSMFFFDKAFFKAGVFIMTFKKVLNKQIAKMLKCI